MAKYIDYEALMRTIDETVVFTVREGTKLPTADMRGANKVIDRIKSAPAADVVEVVRCKDCKHFSSNYCGICNCGCGLRVVDGNAFCSYGEKRSEGK